MDPKKSLRALRSLAIFEAIKGLLGLALGVGFLGMINHHTAHALTKFAGFLYLNPARDYPKIFARFEAKFDHPKLFALGALTFGAVRFAEAYGLWSGRRWAEWLALISSALILPIEIYEFCLGSWKAGTIFIVNVAIVLFLIAQLRQRTPPVPTDQD